MKLALAQVQEGRRCAFERPNGAASWRRHVVDMIRKLPGVMEVVIDQCEFGLSVVEGALSRESTRVMSNDPALFRQLSGRQCRGGHEHPHLEGGHVTRKSHVHPLKLCKAFAHA
eukprot:4727048-Pyramimonas_sp.AAC.1